MGKKRMLLVLAVSSVVSLMLALFSQALQHGFPIVADFIVYASNNAIAKAKKIPSAVWIGLLLWWNFEISLKRLELKLNNIERKIDTLRRMS